ncbi:MAG: MSCRAMM family protein, partial [Blastocatellia bacterium]
TDDRGVYRLYGMLPGTYIVFTRTSGAGVTSPFPTPYDGDVPTYHPSSTRDTAVEVTVASGGEASGIDIRHRGDRGRTLSGVVSGGKEATSTPAASVVLFDTSAAISTGSSYVRPGAERGFAFSGLPDGEYVIIARSAGDDIGMASAWRRISLRGSDISGVELKLLPLGSISGRVVIEASPDACDGKRKIPLEEFSPTAARDDLMKDDLVFLPWRNFSSSRVNEKGEFTINDVDPGHYRIGMRLPDENYYLKAITTPASVSVRRGAPAAVNHVSRDGLALKQGEKLAGVTVTVAEGAANLRGKVIAEKTGARLPEKLRAHLVPAEPNAADDVLRYVEAMVRADGSFALNNLAPGKYLLYTRQLTEKEATDGQIRPAAWDAVERAKLRREAEAAKNEIELQPCQRVKDHVLRFNR